MRDEFAEQTFFKIAVCHLPMNKLNVILVYEQVIVEQEHNSKSSFLFQIRIL